MSNDNDCAFGCECQTDLRKARAIIVELMKELDALHSHTYPECANKGPDTCPTWGAIHEARTFIEATKEADECQPR